MRFNAEAAYNELQPHFKERIHRDEPMAAHSAFGVGGPAELWVSLISTEELVGMVRLCSERRWPLLIVGNGTNVLYADAGVHGIVAHIALNTYRIEPTEPKRAFMVAYAGVSWPSLLQELATQGWGGLEFGVGIPGTLGGAVISNAGAHNDDLGKVLEWIEVLDARGCSQDNEEEEQEYIRVPLVRRYHHDELDLGYRHSRFREEHRVHFDEQGHLVPAPRHLIEPPEIVMHLGINLHHEEPERLHSILERHLLHRKKTQPPQQHTGLIFKDPSGDTANRLIALTGIQGRTHGKAQISTLAPNFIINQGGALATDVTALIEEMHRSVFEQCGVDLEVEIEMRGEW